MKVLFFVYKFPVLSETFIINQIAYFINSGCDVSIVSVFPGDVNIKHEIINKFDLLNKVQYLLNKEPDNKIARVLWRLKSVLPFLLNPVIIKSLDFKKYGYYSKVLILPQILSKNKKEIQMH